MLAIVGSLIFASALAASCAVIAAMIAPQWARIVSLLAGESQPAFAPLARLAVAERRIAVRHWASRPVPAAISRLRAVA